MINLSKNCNILQLQFLFSECQPEYAKLYAYFGTYAAFRNFQKCIYVTQVEADFHLILYYFKNPLGV